MTVRAPSGQALVSDGAPADRHPSGFDPSRVEEVMGGLSWCYHQCESIVSICSGASQMGGDPNGVLEHIASTASDIMINLETAGERLRDSDGSGEAGETGTGSTEGDSAGRQASPKDPQP